MFTILRQYESTLHAVRWGQNFPNPNGGVILRSKLTTSRCFIRPLFESLDFQTKKKKEFILTLLRDHTPTIVEQIHQDDADQV